ncbi:hypothetical protein NEI07_10200, partial [Methylocystis sp. NLS-7]|nr:hypothetical protein [Methylocystis suflitae]
AESKPTPPPATEAKPAAPPPAAPPAATEATPSPKPATDAKTATRERQKKCAAEWNEKKAELKKSDKKITWPKYWSECNKKLKAAGE